VLENDVDWDLRIKTQMKQFAQASRLLLQPLRDTKPGSKAQFLDPTNPAPRSGDEPTSFDVHDQGLANRTLPPQTSPYGDLDRWDMLWLGHCGARFPYAKDRNTPLARAVISDDETVPEKQHIAVEFGDNQLLEQYPHHTRVVSRARDNLCSLGHAFSQQGARRFLYEMAVRKLTDPTDVSFRQLCQGEGGRALATCLSVQPQLFQHHRARGSRASESDISSHGDDFNEHGYTENVRWSTKLNIPRLIEGRTDWIDIYPDGRQGPQWPKDDF
jgi:hypothetical protein